MEEMQVFEVQGGKTIWLDVSPEALKDFGCVPRQKFVFTCCSERCGGEIVGVGYCKCRACKTESSPNGKKRLFAKLNSLPFVVGTIELDDKNLTLL